MRMLRLVGRKHNVPIIVTLTLPSPKAKRMDKRPRMIDLDGWEYVTGDLANIVIFLYRESVCNPGSLNPHIAEAIVTKNEYGAPGTVELAYLSQYCRFENLCRE
jgi:replicative DNA helicase